MIAEVLYLEVTGSNPAGSGGSTIGKIRILHGTLTHQKPVAGIEMDHQCFRKRPTQVYSLDFDSLDMSV